MYLHGIDEIYILINIRNYVYLKFSISNLFQIDYYLSLRSLALFNTKWKIIPL